MKRRIRKKLHIGEFQEFGFPLKFKVRPDTGDPEYDAFVDAFIEEVERLELGFGGGVGETCDGYVVNFQRVKRGRRCGSVNEAQRQALQQWLQNHPQVYEVIVGPLADVWNSPFEEDDDDEKREVK
ncbi:MAG: YggL family protein [Pseudomonadota bacterium]